jgi:hypothetical protein
MVVLEFQVVTNRISFFFVCDKTVHLFYFSVVVTGKRKTEKGAIVIRRIKAGDGILARYE